MIPTTARLGGIALFLLMSASYGWTAQVQPPNVTPPQPLRPAAGLTAVIKSQHVRLPFPKDIQRVAVGDAEILSFELINNREILVLGRDTGRTTLIVWFADGTLREYLFAVHRDLSVLQGALRRVHAAIEVESAPDRDAIILTGTVPNFTVSQTAEAVARSYLDAGDSRRGMSARPFLSAQPGAPPLAPDAVPGAPPLPGAQSQQPPAVPSAAPAAPRPDAVRLQGDVPPSGTIINLLRLETLPSLPEEKIKEAIHALGGQRVTIRRILHGNLRDDAKDTLVLEGSVPNQVALVRVLEVAAQLFAGQTITTDDIRVVADESGALASRGQDTAGQNTQLGTTGGVGVLFGGNRSTVLSNQIRRNLGRATAIEAAGGRILSFIEVTDLPQIRVDIRLLEVNRTRLRAFNPDSALLTSNFRQPSLNPSQSAGTVQGTQAVRVGGVASSAVQNVLSFLGGSLLNQFQLATQNGAVAVALSLLEREGIARSLSSPSLTVLSGELAQFQVGGQVPIPIAFLPTLGTGTATTSLSVTAGIFNSVEFVQFGVQLQIRPLVGDDDSITLDVQPQIVTPDSSLTDTIRQTTGTNPLTTAFQTRALRTSSRLQDGQALLIGGLTSANSSNNTASTPGARDLPGLGWLFRSFNRNDESVELVVVVNPVIVRTPVPDSALWAFPGHQELMKSVVIPPTPPAKPPPKPNPNKGGAQDSNKVR
jgi:pilus assembly protein CpaC